MTVADRAAVGLVLLAGLFAAWACGRAGAIGLAALALAVAVVAAATQVIDWTRSRHAPPWELERLADGRLQVRRGAGRPVPVAVGSGTRRLGPSVFLDLTFANGSCREHCRRWITPCDAPAQSLRRWRVVLPSLGSRASG
ncbi:MAG TPA: hypothetical protein VF851_10080 [Steroidobacteraceae bacterium]